MSLITVWGFLVQIFLLCFYKKVSVSALIISSGKICLKNTWNEEATDYLTLLFVFTTSRLQQAQEKGNSIICFRAVILGSCRLLLKANYCSCISEIVWLESFLWLAMCGHFVFDIHYYCEPNIWVPSLITGG